MPVSVPAPSEAAPALPVMDIEASGFGRGSYPIEVGYVLPDGRAWCTLVKHLPHWTHWDPAAEALHHIARPTLLRHGRTPTEVARQLNQDLAGLTVYCDGWAHDYARLGALFDAADQTPRFRLESAARLLSDQALPQLAPAMQRARRALSWSATAPAPTPACCNRRCSNWPRNVASPRPRQPPTEPPLWTWPFVEPGWTDVQGGRR